MTVSYNQREYRLQLAVVKHLNSAFPELLYTHVPNRPANAQDGYFKKMMGLRAGVPDLVFWWPQYQQFAACNHIKCGGIELKASRGKWGNDQNRFASYFTHIGGKYEICRSVQEVHNVLLLWGIPAKHHQCIEPDYATKEEKFQRGMEFFKP